ncbi:MAG: hypothetical protein K2M00_07920 [Muribaculaceae bacterium]|nr:hypothetical protein [Muribaculaceae bacterium]
MRLELDVLSELCKRAGCDVTSSAGATILCHDIESVTGERLAVNTVKRLTGVLPYDNYPRASTLDIIARYLGYESWRNYKLGMIPPNSQFDSKGQFTNMAHLPEGRRVKITWEPGRVLVMTHRGDGLYIVDESINGKLRAGDLLQLTTIRVGFPFIAVDVERDGLSLGEYTAARDTGITSIIIE